MAEEKKGDIFTESMSTAMMMVAAFVVLAPFLQRMLSNVQATTVPSYVRYQGIMDERILRVTSVVRWVDLVHAPPYTPWKRAFFINDGPAPVELGINQPEGRVVIGVGETRTLDRTAADDLIYALFYVCPVGETSTLRVEGEY